MASNVAILIIGSLAWDNRRAAWRRDRLAQHEAVPVAVPIRYGRCSRSRGNTYTMIFTPGGSPFGRGLLLPCLRAPQEFDGLWREAVELWAAEVLRQPANPNPADERIGSSSSGWGAVGLLPRSLDHPLVARWKARWKEEGRTHLARVSANCSALQLDADGILKIGWPPGVPEGIDLILATTNEPKGPATPAEIAGAWVGHQACGSGWEEYFFRNVELGIQTHDDREIWAELERAKPAFIEDPVARDRGYAKAIKILRSDASGRAESQ